MELTNTNTNTFSFNADNTFASFSDYANKYLQSAMFITDDGKKLILPKFGKSLLSAEGNVIFVHSYAQANSTDKLFNNDQMIVRQRMLLSFIRFAKAYDIQEYAGHHAKVGTLSFKYDNVQHEIPCKIVWVVNFEEKLFKCILSADEYSMTHEEEEEVHAIIRRLNY